MIRIPFTVPTERTFTLATLDPVPTEAQLADAFQSMPWADQIAVVAHDRLYFRSWLTNYRKTQAEKKAQ
jgi:hypothetical protein